MASIYGKAKHLHVSIAHSWEWLQLQPQHVKQIRAAAVMLGLSLSIRCMNTSYQHYFGIFFS